MCRICRSRRNRRRCRPRRVRRPRSPAATSRSTPTARTASLARTRARIQHTMSLRRAYGCQSWKPETSPARQWTRAAPCWSFRTPGFLCRCPRERFPSRCGRSCIWRCSTRIVTGPDYPVSANYSWRYGRKRAAGTRCRALRSRSCAREKTFASVDIRAMPWCYFYINARSARASDYILYVMFDI